MMVLLISGFECREFSTSDVGETLLAEYLPCKIFRASVSVCPNSLSNNNIKPVNAGGVDMGIIYCYYLRSSCYKCSLSLYLLFSRHHCNCRSLLTQDHVA
jgi:hypothetical protein